MITSWNYPTSVRFGAGAIAELPEACRSLGMQNPLQFLKSSLKYTQLRLADVLFQRKKNDHLQIDHQ